MFLSTTYRKKSVQNLETRSNALWEQFIDDREAASHTRYENVVEEGFWFNYEKLLQKSRKKQPVSPRKTIAPYIPKHNYKPLYTFSEFGRLYALLNGTVFSFCFLFILSAMVNKNLLMQKELYFSLLPFCLMAGIFFARPFKTCSVTSSLLIIRHPWMLINKTFVLHHIREVTIDDDPNGYWFLNIRTNQQLYRYSVNINYCKLRKLLDFLGENHITTYDKISLTVY